jgi:DNA-binding CsgD family transcriptional regulator/tetratricopeptide (TPR) repeat protein
VSTRVASPHFVGRAAELARLEQLTAQAAAGEPAFALIGGESGVGKSRLLEEFASAAVRGGARVITGDCVDLGDAELPYAPLVGALRGVGADELGRLLPRGASELSTLLPQLQEEAGERTPASLTQARLFELLLGLLGGLGADGPLVLLIEDAHWADPSTRDFLSFLIANCRSERLLVAVSYRTDELHRRHPLRTFLAEADRTRSVTRITLERFTKTELTQQLDGILGYPPAPELVEELFRRAEGNAFFSEELLAVGGASAEVRLPDDVRDALMLRIEALGADAQAALRVAAAAGGRVRHALLEAAGQLQREALLTGLREAVAHHVLVQEHDSDIYRFRHALLREALLDDLLPGERGPLHAAIGRALAADPSLSASGRSVAAELAAHWFAAHDLPAAFAASAQAGAEAEGMAAYAEANRHFERAAELWDAVSPEQRAGGPDRVELLRRAAEAIHFTGDTDRALALCRRALSLIDESSQPMLAASLHERVGRYLWTAGQHGEAVDELRLAAATMPGDARAVDRARVLGAEAHVLMLVGRGKEARARGEQALVLAREAGSLVEECRILNTLGPALQMTGETDAAIAMLQEGRRLSIELNDPEELMRSYVNLAEILDQDGRIVEAAQVSREGVEMARQEGSFGFGLPMLIAELAQRLIRLGEWDEAAAVLADATAPSRSWEVGRIAALSALAYIQAVRGDRDGVSHSLRELEVGMVDFVGAMWTAPVALARAEAALWLGDPATARDAAAGELSGDEEIVIFWDFLYVAPLLSVGARAQADLAVAARAVGNEAELEQIVARANEIGALSQRLIEASSQPEAVLYAQTAMLEVARAQISASADEWRALGECWEQRGNPYPAAYCRWRAADLVLAGGGPRGDVQEMLDSAYRAAQRLGAEPLRHEISDLARRARVTLSELHGAEADDGEPVAEDGEGAHDLTAAQRIGLTARELDVLRLMAGGATNREIAASLFISQKTVTVHITRILAKLDARTRVEAAGMAQRLGLLVEDTAAS